MADTKITALTALTAADPANDVIPIVDVSDTTMAASGTTKKISVNNILGASGTATLASATITGAATVGTTLGVTGVSTFAAGTALLPALTTTGDTNTGIYYPAADTIAVTTGGTERYRVDSAGNFGIGVAPAGTGGCLQLKSGITFPVTQVASSDANTLDDYEEGTFTPTITGSTAAGVGTYSNQIGRYTKIGNQVTVWIRISWSAHTGTGDMRISDLPFAIANVNNLGSGAAIGYSANITLTAGNYLMLYGNPGTTRIDFWQTPTGGGATTTVSMDSSADIGITMTYFV